MTLREVVRALARRWYVLALALAVGAAGFAVLVSGGGVFSTQPIVAFLLPGGRALAADNGVEAEGIIAFAAAVADKVNDGRPAERYAAEDAPLYGAGLNQEIRVGVPDVGGQWGTSYTRAEIAVSVVGSTESWVAENSAEMIQRVFDIADAEQAARGVPEAERIEMFVMPLSTEVQHITSSTSQRMLAGGAIGLAALIVGGVGAMALDRIVQVRRRRAVVIGSRHPVRGAHP